MKPLKQLNRIACTAATIIERTTPQASLELMTYIQPLDLHIKEMTIKAFIRLEGQLDTSWQPRSFLIPHLAHCKSISEGIGTEDDRCDFIIIYRVGKKTNSL